MVCTIDVGDSVDVVRLKNTYILGVAKVRIGNIRIRRKTNSLPTSLHNDNICYWGKLIICYQSVR